MIVEMELMEPQELPEELPATLLRQYIPLGADGRPDQTPGGGIVCLFEVATLEDASTAAEMLFGESNFEISWRLRKVSDSFYTHEFY